MDNDLPVRVSGIQIVTDYRAVYLAILEEEARKSVELEPGVIGILPLLYPDGPSQLRIGERYRNRAACEAHIGAPHCQHYETATRDMTASRACRAAMERLAGLMKAAGTTFDVAFEPAAGTIDDTTDAAYREQYEGSPCLRPMIGEHGCAATVKVVSRAMGWSSSFFSG